MPIDSERVSRARAILAHNKLDGLICRLPENLLSAGYLANERPRGAGFPNPRRPSADCATGRGRS